LTWGADWQLPATLPAGPLRQPRGRLAHAACRLVGQRRLSRQRPGAARGARSSVRPSVRPWAAACRRPTRPPSSRDDAGAVRRGPGHRGERVRQAHLPPPHPRRPRRSLRLALSAGTGTATPARGHRGISCAGDEEGGRRQGDEGPGAQPQGAARLQRRRGPSRRGWCWPGQRSSRSGRQGHPDRRICRRGQR